jgi:hypothetical protein
VARVPAQALVQLRPSASTQWCCDTVEDDLGLRVSVSTMTRGLALLGETRKKLTLLARRPRFLPRPGGAMRSGRAAAAQAARSAPHPPAGAPQNENKLTPQNARHLLLMTTWMHVDRRNIVWCDEVLMNLFDAQEIYGRRGPPGPGPAARRRWRRTRRGARARRPSRP